MKKKLLVTGASGFLGWNVCTFPQTDWDIFGTFHSNNNLPNSVTPIELNLLDFEKTTEVVQSLCPDAILHLAANSSTYLCEKSPEDTEPVNVTIPTFLAKLADEIKAHFIFTSSEQVFDGTAFTYLESTIPSPKNVYGQQKRAAELAILNYKNVSIVRIAVLFGNAGEGTRNFMHEWLDKWRNNKSITVFYDEIRSFLSGQSAAQGLFILLNQQATGVFHLAGADNISRLDFAHLLKTHANLPDAQIISLSQKKVNTLAFRPQNLGLDCSNSERLGFMKKGVVEEFERLDNTKSKETLSDNQLKTNLQCGVDSSLLP